MARKIVVTSGKGGVGKTTVCVFLGLCLAKLNKKVIILDLDFSLNNLDVVAGVEDKVCFDIADVVEGRCRVKQAIVPVRQNLAVIQSGKSDFKRVTGQNVRLLMEGLSGYDYILLDCPAGMDTGFDRAISSADEAMIVLNPTLTSMRDADKVVNALRLYRIESVFAVVNKVRGDLQVKGKTMSVAEIENVVKLPVIGAIPDDDGILLAESVDSVSGDAMKAFKLLAKRLVKGSGRVFDCTKRYTGILGSLMRKLKRRC
ncbi:MAG: AAA family ATPase [Clostridia bacterium]|nr:AAA family ATPase [Clostridia bacterium]